MQLPLDPVLAVVRQAADLTSRIQESFVTPVTWEKRDKSPVTVGDLAVQTLVAAKLEELTPDVPLVAEESAELLRSEDGARFLEILLKFTAKYLPEVTAERILGWISRGKNDDSLMGTSRFWVLDPIDGTKGYLRKEQYAIALGLVEKGVVTAGFLGLPRLTWLKGRFTTAPQASDAPRGSVLYARRGKGAWVDQAFGSDGIFERLHVSQVADTAAARVLRSVEAGHTNVGKIDQFMDCMGITASPVHMDSQAKYAMLASGGGDIMLRLLSHSQPDYREKIWDHAAGMILVEEAGGRVSDLDGKPLEFTHGAALRENRGVCVTNGLLHDATLAALREIGA